MYIYFVYMNNNKITITFIQYSIEYKDIWMLSNAIHNLGTHSI